MKNVVTTIGAYEAMYAAFQALVNPGDEVCYILYCCKYMWVLFIKLARPVLQPLYVLPLMEVCCGLVILTTLIVYVIDVAGDATIIIKKTL